MKFTWWKITQASIAKDQAVVHIPDAPDEEVVVRENLFEVDGPVLFADGRHHQHKAGDKGLPIGLHRN